MKLKALTVACLAVASLSSVAALAADYQYRYRVNGLVARADPAASLALDEAALPQAKTGLTFSYDLKSLIRWTGLKSGAQAPAVTLSADTLPAGLALVDGVLTGTPTAKGRHAFTVTARAGDQTSSTQYELDAAGEAFVLAYGDGRWKSSGNGYFAGNYARKATISMGTPHYTDAGRRVMGYLYRNSDSSICEFRLGVSLNEGWTPSSPTFADGAAFANGLNKARLYDANGRIVKTYTLSATSFTGEGYIRKAAASCADVNAFYSTPGLYSQALFSQY